MAHLGVLSGIPAAALLSGWTGASVVTTTTTAPKTTTKTVD
jgi:hypothetical protein